MGNRNKWKNTKLPSARPRNRRLAQLRRYQATSCKTPCLDEKDNLQEPVVSRVQTVQSNLSHEVTDKSNAPPAVDSHAIIAIEEPKEEGIEERVGVINKIMEESEEEVLEIEPQRELQQEFHPEGRRLVAIDWFFQQLLGIKDHGACGCNITNMFILKENRFGLNSIITLKCKMCNKLMDISTDYPQKTELCVNEAAT
ncbi:hypothetical protein RN001_002296 [Aquatica leii]|uniref:Mutator-like transposase domain-containing protein n=1 Tax=Aquatica leii TaxID=1421715 RepID=A0AAN7QB11_9COLE|nr:hypothetical protein RN001_002296 [Aquatica leii]